MTILPPSPRRSIATWAPHFALLSALLFLGPIARAGNGPHNWLVVYDPNDAQGVAIARHYQAVRGFPDANMVAYTFPRTGVSGSANTIGHSMTAAQCWTLITTLRQTITDRGLDGQIHGITLVGNAPMQVTEGTSSNGTVAITTALMMAPGTTSASQWENRWATTNRLYRSYHQSAPFPFEVNSETGYGTNNERYWMATHLGPMGGRGLRGDEVLDLIDRTAPADGTAPAATVYWPLNSNIRSANNRGPEAPTVQAEWQAIGLPHHIYGQDFGGGNHYSPQDKMGAPGSFPIDERLVQGVIAGLEVADIFDRPSLYMPGAIADHVTSFGGQVTLTIDHGQTPATEWLRAGASGSSGTVVEPYNTPVKFTSPRIHADYWAGATLGECHLFSLQTPWQTLIMGDGLAQPFADVPVVTLSGITDGATLSGTIALVATATAKGPVETHLDLAINGRLIRIGDPGEPYGVTRTANGFSIDTTTLPNGWHELRAVAYSGTPVRSQGFATRRVLIQNGTGSIALAGPAAVTRGGNFTVTATPTGLTNVASIQIRALGQTLATLGTAGGNAQIPSERLSYTSGNRLVAVAMLNNGKEVVSAPLEVTLNWLPMAAQPPVPTVDKMIGVARYFADVRVSGFNWNTATPQLVVPVNDRYELTVRQAEQWPGLAATVQKSGQNAGVEFVTRFYAQRTGFYDFAGDSQEWIGLVIDGVEISPVRASMRATVHLEAGWHDLRARGRIARTVSATSFPFRIAFRTVGSGRFHPRGHFVAGYEYLSLSQCAAPAAAFEEAHRVLLAGRSEGAGSASFSWSGTFTGETGWTLERFVGDPAVELVEYLGNQTAPSLLPSGHPNAFGPLAPVANDESGRFTVTPTWLESCVRLITAGADRLSGPSATLYRVRVPAGTTVYALINRANETLPTWFNNQSSQWTLISNWGSNNGNPGEKVESEATSAWHLYQREVTAETILELGGAGRSGTNPEPAQAITFLFRKTGGPWQQAGAFAAGSRSGTVSGLAQVEQRFRLRGTVAPDGLVTSNAITINPGTAVANAAPVVSAGSALSLAMPGLSALLDGWAQDDAQPAPPQLTTTWSQVTGPGTVVFANPAAARTTATFPSAGFYVLKLTASDGLLESNAEVQVAVGGGAAANLPPTVNAGADQTITTAQGLQLAGSASDDGLPAMPGRLTYLWRQISGPAPAIVSNARVAQPSVAFPRAGTYELEFSSSDGQKSASDTVTITVGPDPNQPPVVSAGTGAEVFAMSPIPLQGSVSDDGLPNPPGALSIAWSMASGPATASFANPQSPTTTVEFPAVGTYILRLSASDGPTTSSSTVTFTAVANTANNTPPTIGLANALVFPYPGQHLVDPETSDDGIPAPPRKVTLGWELLDGPGKFRAYNLSPNHPLAFHFETPGNYNVRLSATDSSLTTTKDIAIQVDDTGLYNQIHTWGRNNNGQLGTHTDVGSSGDLIVAPPIMTAVRWVQVACGEDSTFALGSNGKVYASGSNANAVGDQGQLGVPYAQESLRKFFAKIPGLENVKEIAHTTNSGVALKQDGTVWTWGSNDTGQLGRGAVADNPTPAQVASLSNIRAIAANGGWPGGTVLAIRADKTVVGWGRNSSGQLGSGNTTERNTPVQMQGITNAKAVAVGDQHCLVLLEDGTVRATGLNSWGQLGNNTTTNSSTPVQVLTSTSPVTPLTGIRKVVAGLNYSMALDNQGQIWTWGYNFNYQLGRGTTSTGSFPIAARVVNPNVAGQFLSGIRDIAAGSTTSYAVAEDGTALVWGRGSYGQLGQSNNLPLRHLNPTPVVGLPRVNAIWAGYQGAFATTGPVSYESFVTRHYNTTEIATGLAEPDADPAGSGLANLMAYALGRDPRLRLSTRPPITSRIEGDEMVFESQYLAAADDLDVSFETSTDLTHWVPADPASANFLEVGDLERAIFRFSPEDAPLFLRLKVHLTP